MCLESVFGIRSSSNLFESVIPPELSRKWLPGSRSSIRLAAGDGRKHGAARALTAWGASWLGAVAPFDYDGDEFTDIIVTDGARIAMPRQDSPGYFNRLFRSLGGLRFRDVTEEAGLACEGYLVGAAAAGYDNAGRLHLFRGELRPLVDGDGTLLR